MIEFICNQNRQLRELVVNYPFLFTNKAPVAASNQEYFLKCGYGLPNRLSAASIGYYQLDILEKYKENFLFGRFGSQSVPYEFTFYLGEDFHMVAQIHDVPKDAGEAASPKDSRFVTGIALFSTKGENVKRFVEENSRLELVFEKKPNRMGFAFPQP